MWGNGFRQGRGLLAKIEVSPGLVGLREEVLFSCLQTVSPYSYGFPVHSALSTLRDPDRKDLIYEIWCRGT